MKKIKPILHDPTIIPRVQQYLEENVDKTYVDVGVMAKELQVRYPEYGRRKTVPFRLLVEQAYKTVLHSYGLDSNPSSEGEDDDLEVMDNSVQPGRSNQMSEMLKNLYSNKSGNKLPTNEGDPIDISSDDSEDESSPPPMPRQRSLTPKPVEVPKLSNVVITIQKRPVDTETPIENGLAKKRKVDEPPTLRNVTPVPITATAPVQPQASVSSKSKKYKKEIAPKTSTVTFNDMGGMVKTLKQLCELLMHLKHPEIYEHFGLPPPRGFLLHGPPGSGKTLLARAIAGQLNIPLLEVAATELIAGVTGESEERIRDVFEQAAALAPCVLFMDEIDAISSNRLNAQKDMERRIVAQLLNSLDGLSTKVGGNQVLVIGATNRPDSLDPALRRVGRFDQEILLGIPDRLARKEILQILCKNVKLEEGFDYDKLAVLTPGYVGADLLALAARAVSTAVKRIFRDKKQELCKKQSEMQASEESKEKDALLEIDDLLDSIANKELKINGGISNENDETIQILDDTETEIKAADEVNTEKLQETETHSDMITDLTENTADSVPAVEKMDTDETPQVEDSAVVDVAMTDVTNAETKQSESLDTTQPTEETKVVEIRDENEAKPVEKSEAEQLSELLNENKDVPVDTTDIPEKIPEETVTEVSQEEKTIELDEHEKIASKPIELDANSSEGIEVTESKIIKEVKQQVINDENLTLDDLLTWLKNGTPPITRSELIGFCTTMQDFVHALKLVQPSAKREGFITVPDVTWDDIGSLADIREELKLAILAPVKYPKQWETLGLSAPSGVLLCGPPGCGKTLLAKAVANEAGINFISVKGPELLNMYVGESERAVRQCFQRARNSAPCVIFFDEFDALCPKRSESSENSAGMRVVNQLLTEMDGVEERKGIFLMAATNRPDIIDPAVLRPGRFDKILYVGLPNEQDRVDILLALTKYGVKPPLDEDVNLKEVAQITEGFTGADLAGLMRQSALQALKSSMYDLETEDNIIMDVKVNKSHIFDALSTIKPSVSKDDKLHYDKFRQKYGKHTQTNIQM